MPFIDQIKIGSTTRDIQDSGARANEGTLSNLTTTEKTNLVGAINELKAESSNLKSQIANIEDAIGGKEAITWNYTDGCYVKTSVSPISTSDPYTVSASYHGKCAFISCSPGDVFIISLLGGAKYRPYAFYDSTGAIISAGENVQYHDLRVVAPADTAYIALNSDPNDAYGTAYKDTSVINAMQNEIDQIINTYKGLSCVAFGTSLTYRDVGYRPYLAEMLGMTIDNQGDASSHWYYFGTSNNLLYNVQQYADYADKDLCLIEGCVNDWGDNRTLGTYKDTGTDTVCGCLYNMISHIYTQNPSIQIIVILDHFGKINGSVDCSSSALNSDNKTQYDYYDECAKLCDFYGIPCIKEYALSSIGIFGEQYLTDQIHCNALGAQQSAKIIGKAMLNLVPKVIS